MGYVVDDIEAAMHYWLDILGVGPWFYDFRMPVVEFTCRGTSYDPVVSIALANLGDTQIELLQPRDDQPTLYREFLDRGLTGLQHFANWTTDFDGDRERLQERGFTPVQTGIIGPRGRFAYFENRGELPSIPAGTVVELSEVVGAKGRFFADIRNTAARWTGNKPIREFPDLSAY